MAVGKNSLLAELIIFQLYFKTKSNKKTKSERNCNTILYYVCYVSSIQITFKGLRANLTLYSTALYCQNGPHKIYQKYNMVKRIWFTIEKRIEKRVNGTVNHRLYNNIIIFSLYTLGNHANVCKINDGQPIWFTPMSTSNVHVTCIVIYFISECYHSTMAQRNDGRLPIHRPWVQNYVDTNIFF